MGLNPRAKKELFTDRYAKVLGPKGMAGADASEARGNLMWRRLRFIFWLHMASGPVVYITL